MVLELLDAVGSALVQNWHRILVSKDKSFLSVLQNPMLQYPLKESGDREGRVLFQNHLVFKI